MLFIYSSTICTVNYAKRNFALIPPSQISQPSADFLQLRRKPFQSGRLYLTVSEIVQKINF